MRINRGLLGWGVFFIALGAVPLAVQSGALPANIARRAWELWPLLLVGAGLGLALRSTSVAWLGSLVVALTLGLMAGGVAAGGWGAGPVSFCSGSERGGTSGSQSASGSLSDGATVGLSVDCGALSVTTAPGSAWSATWQADWTTAPIVSNPSPTRLAIEFGQSAVRSVGVSQARWDAVLPTDPTLDVSLSLNAGSAVLDLAGARIAALDASVNAGDAKINLGGALGTRNVHGSANAGSLSITLPSPDGVLGGSLSANAGSVAICVPDGVALRLRVADQSLSSTNFADRGLTQSGDTWSRGNASGADSRIELEVSANLGSITLNPAGGCG